MLPLPAASNDARHAMDILAALGWLVAAIAAVCVIGFVLHRRLRAQNDRSAQSSAFSLKDLRRMRDEGQLTAEEYERARTRVISQTQRSLNEDAPQQAGRSSEGSRPRDSDKTGA